MPTWISLGAFADVDPTEGNTISENAADLLGTYDNTQLSFVNAVATDTDNDGIVATDDAGAGEPVTVDGVTSTLDSLQVYNATVMTGDGTLQNITVGVAQLTNGQAYIVPTDEVYLDNTNIQSIELTSVLNDNYNGMWVASANRSIDNASVVCFASGTMIATDTGPRAVETLTPGDLIQTIDHGLQTLRWIGSRHVRTDENTRPVRIARHALGNGCPETDLLVSPQHRLLARSKIAERIFGQQEVLIAAKKLVGMNDIEWTVDVPDVTYWHLLFDRHEIVFANGTPAESLYSGPMALAAMDAQARQAMVRVNPCLDSPDVELPRAREFATGRKLKSLLSRHAKNAKPLLSVPRQTSAVDPARPTERAI